MKNLDYLLAELDRLQTLLARTTDKELRAKLKGLIELTNDEIEYYMSKEVKNNG